MQHEFDQYQTPHPLNIQLPLLQSETALEGHLRRVLILLSEYRLVNNGKIIDGYNFSVLSLVVETFRGVPAVYSEAQYQVEVEEIYKIVDNIG